MKEFKEIPDIENKEDFLSKVIIDNSGCWIWNGRIKCGSPIYQPKGCRDALSARRVSFYINKWQPAKDMVIGATCGKRLCVNPEHMEERTEMSNFSHVETSPMFIKANSLFCKNGHELNHLNVYCPPKTPQIRKCKICRDQAQKRRKDTPEKHEALKKKHREHKRKLKNEN